MSLEAALAENTAALSALGAILAQIDQNQQRLLAGQAAAIDKVEAPKATRTRKAKDEAPAPAPEPEAAKPAAEEPAPTESGADDADNASDVISAEDLFAYASGYLSEVKDSDPATYQARGKFLKGMLTSEFGDKKIKELDDADDRKRVYFYLRRFAAGLKVDFAAEYDFDSDPTADDGAGDDFEI